MNTHITLALVAALTGCATPAPQSQPVPQASACHSQLVNQRLFMLVAGRGLQACIERPGYDSCMTATTTVESMQASLGIDHDRFRSCFPEYLRTDREAFKETAVELNVFHKQLTKASDLMNRAAKVGHF